MSDELCLFPFTPGMSGSLFNDTVVILQISLCLLSCILMISVSIWGSIYLYLHHKKIISHFCFWSTLTFVRMLGCYRMQITNTYCQAPVPVPGCPPTLSLYRHYHWLWSFLTNVRNTQDRWHSHLTLYQEIPAAH